MTPLKDERLLAAYTTALAENRRFSGYVLWKPLAQDWLFRELPGMHPRQIAGLMYEHVQAGGEIDQIRETREEWLDFSCHYDVRLLVADRHIYIESVFLSDDPDDPQIEIVNIHDV
jgi:hypothetical protein